MTPTEGPSHPRAAGGGRVPAKWTAQQVVALAADHASAKAGRGLADPRKWVSLGCGPTVIWGECQGSGKNPYQTQVDLHEPALKCSCPSRKSPCKHALGLPMLYAESPKALAETQPPRVGQRMARIARGTGAEAGGAAGGTRSAGGGPRRTAAPPFPSPESLRGRLGGGPLPSSGLGIEVQADWREGWGERIGAVRAEVHSPTVTRPRTLAHQTSGRGSSQ